MNIIDEYKNPLIVKSEKKYKDSRFDFYIKKADNKINDNLISFFQKLNEKCKKSIFIIQSLAC